MENEMRTNFYQDVTLMYCPS